MFRTQKYDLSFKPQEEKSHLSLILIIMMQLSVNLTFDGNCHEAMTYYKEVFGCDEMSCMAWKELTSDVPDEYKDTLLCAELAITKSITLSAGDRNPMKRDDEPFVIGTNTQVRLRPSSREEMDKVFAGLSKDGVVEMAPSDEHWGRYIAGCKDKFGIRWLLEMPLPSKDGKMQVKQVAASLRSAADVAIAEADKLEKMVE